MRTLCLRAINLGFGFTEEVAITVRKHFKKSYATGVQVRFSGEAGLLSGLLTGGLIPCVCAH